MKTTFSISGNSPVRSSLREKHNTDKGKFNTEMISREESPTWSTARRKELDYAESKNENEELPSWDALEATLNRRLCNYALPESLDEGVGEKLRYERTTQEWFPRGKSPSGEENGEQAFSTRCVGDASCVHRLRRDIQAGTKNVDESNLRLDYSLPAFGKSSNKRFEYIW